MRKILLSFLMLLFTVNVYAADTKLSDLDEDASPGTDSIIYTVDDPLGTPVQKKTTVGDLFSTLETDPSVDTADEIEAILVDDAMDFGTGTLASANLTITGTASISSDLTIGGTLFGGHKGSVGMVIDGNGSTITAGIKGDITIPYGGTLETVTMLADTSGSITLDVWKDILSNYPPTNDDSIVGTGRRLEINSDTNYSFDLTSGATTYVRSGDTFRFNVDSADTITRCTIQFTVDKR